MSNLLVKCKSGPRNFYDKDIYVIFCLVSFFFKFFDSFFCFLALIIYNSNFLQRPKRKHFSVEIIKNLASHQLFSVRFVEIKFSLLMLFTTTNYFFLGFYPYFLYFVEVFLIVHSLPLYFILLVTWHTFFVLISDHSETRVWLMTKTRSVSGSLVNR